MGQLGVEPSIHIVSMPRCITGNNRGDKVKCMYTMFTIQMTDLLSLKLLSGHPAF